MKKTTELRFYKCPKGTVLIEDSPNLTEEVLGKIRRNRKVVVSHLPRNVKHSTLNIESTKVKISFINADTFIVSASEPLPKEVANRYKNWWKSRGKPLLYAHVIDARGIDAPRTVKYQYNEEQQ